MGEVAVISLCNILYDRDGVSDGSIMAKETCGGSESIVSFLALDVAMVCARGLQDLLTVSPATHDDELGWIWRENLWCSVKVPFAHHARMSMEPDRSREDSDVLG